MLGIAKKMFGSENDRKLKKMRPMVDKINGLEATFEKLSDDELKAKTPEFRTHRTFRCRVKTKYWFQGRIGDIILDTNGEMIFWTHGFHVVKNSFDHGGVELFGTKPIPATHNSGTFTLFHESCANIHVQRITKGTRLFCPVKKR